MAAPTTRSRTRGGEKVPRLDVEYVRYPFDSSYADYYAKLADALSRVTTPFVVMADNDDLFIPDGLTRAVEFLRAHPDTWPAADNARCSGSRRGRA